MKKTNISEILVLLDDIENLGCGPSRTTRSEELTRPPHVVWRYKKKNESLNKIIIETVASFSGIVKWICFEYGRNLVLMPERVKEIQREKQLSGDVGADNFLQKYEPEFGIKANEELPILAEFLETRLISIAKYKSMSELHNRRMEELQRNKKSCCFRSKK